MGILDFDSVFDILDPARRGYLTPVQIRQFDESLHLSPICTQHVDAAIAQICGSEGVVKRLQFVQVLEDLERRRKLEDQTRWDFMALDRTGNNRISLTDTLMLFKMTHSAQFSMHTWNSFLKSRNSEIDEVYYDEVRMCLCNLPQGSPSSAAKLEQEEERLEDNTEQQTRQEFEAFKTAQESDSHQVLYRKEYEDKTRRLARRKLNRWETEGVEALLYDDGIDYGDNVPMRPRSGLGVNDLLDALDYKYDTLRRKLFLEILRLHHGDVVWTSMSNSEQLDAFEQIQLHERQFRKDGALAERASEILGAATTHSAPLLGMMGEFGPDFYQRQEEMQEMEQKLAAGGKKADVEVDRLLKQEYVKRIQGPAESHMILVALLERFNLEKDALMSRLRPDSKRKLTSKQVISEYCRLVRQHQALEAEVEFVSAALAVGLAERDQGYKPDRYDPDRDRQEELSRLRLAERRDCQMRLPDEGEGATAKPEGVVDLQLQVVRELSWKHATEREFLIHMLQGKDSNVAKSSARQLNSQQRSGHMASLRNQRSGWRDSTTEFRLAQKAVHIDLLQEGVGIYYVNRRELLKQRHADSLEDAINASVLADLQQKQDQEFNTVLMGMQFKNEAELKELWKRERQARKEEHLDNIATVILGTFECSEAETPFLEMLEQKYEALRHLLLMHTLKEEHGIAWDRLTDSERQRLLVRRVVEEKTMREEGRLNDMAKLLEIMPDDTGTLRALMGESKGEYAYRMSTLYEKQQQEAAKGKDFTKIESDETPGSEVKSNNLLADLLKRFYAEQDALIGQLRSPDMQNATKRQWLLPLVLLVLEWKRAEREEWFDIGATSIGLLERVFAAGDKRHKADCDRQNHLATLRLEARTRRVEAGKPYLIQLDEYARPDKGDKAGWMEALLSELDKKHVDEREILLNILQDPCVEDLREAARLMADDDRPRRLAELQGKRKKMDLEDADQREENVSVLEEAAAIRSVLKEHHMETVLGRGVRYDEVEVELLAELQAEQDREMADAIEKITKLNEEEMKVKREHEIDMRHWQAADNVLTVLTKYEGSADDVEILKALDEKYDALRDKLLMEALMRQLGEAEWGKLSEQERQRRLMQLKLLERKLRREGRFDELAKLLGDGAESERLLRQLMGDHRSEYEKKLKERLARRQQRRKQGLDSDGESDIEEADEAGAGKDGEGNALTELQRRYEEERDALQRRLRGVENQALGERERQAELVRLRREARRAQREGNFEQAAMLLGLAERQQAAIAQRLKNDRQRQEQLARRRLEAIRKRKGQKIQEVNDVIKKGDITALQDVVLQRLEEKHEKERLLLVTMLGQSPDQNTLVVAQASSESERQEHQNLLRDRREKVAPENTKENINILTEASVYKVESRRQTLSRQRKDGDTVTDDDVAVSLLADLQERQDREAERYIGLMPGKDDEELIQLQIKVLYEKKYQLSDNIASVVLGYETGSKAGDRELMDALESKYDALRDKLLMEALMAQYGENKWKKMSEQERQHHMMQMRLKERQLRREGRWDELEQLLGAALKNQELLENLLGSSKTEQERLMREKLAKRKERRANGMTEEECDELEKEDDEERKKNRNVLKDIQQCYEQEKEALLRLLGQQTDKLAVERQRQTELTRLKGERRRSRQEEKFNAAALVMGLAQDQEAKLEAARKRQEELARQRLAARLDQRKTSAELFAEQGDVPMPLDDDDVIGLQEAVMREIERKHSEERELLIQLFHDPEVTIHQQTASHMTPEQREDKLEELRSLRSVWRSAQEQHNMEQTSVLKEATGVRVVVNTELLGSQGKDSSEFEVQVALLADLQERQDAENRGLVGDLSEQNADTLKQLKQLQNTARRNQWYENVGVVLLGTHRSSVPAQGSLTSEEQEVVDALERKYDALRDKLLLEALMKQYGSRQWEEMTERERQAKLVKLRLQERKLRQEGKFEEATALLGELMEYQDELEKVLGASRSDQKKQLQERLRRKKKLIEERKAQGLSEDEAVIEALLDEQEKQEDAKRKKQNILETLQHHFDDEKAALLAALGKHDSLQDMERQRQLELARLRREGRQLEQEERFDGAALLLNLAKQQELKLEQNMSTEKERQHALALERIAARRKRGHVAPSEGSEENLAAELKAAEAEARMKAAMELGKPHATGVAALQGSILDEVEQRQCRERDLLLELIAAGETDPECQAMLHNLQIHEMKFELEKLNMECTKWKRTSRHAALRQAEAGDTLTQGDRERYLEEVACSRVEQFKLLTKAMALRMAVERDRQAAMGGQEQKDVAQECTATLLADLQQRQDMENAALHTVLAEQNEDTLGKVHDTQQMALREGWVDNVTNVVFSLDPTEVEGEDEGEGLDRQKVEEELKKEFRREEKTLRKESVRRKAAGETVDVDAELTRLRAQQEARKQAMDETMDRQHHLVQEKLEARRLKIQNVELQNEAISQLLQTADRQRSFVQDKSQSERGRQHELMEQRLEARKLARRQALERGRFLSPGTDSREGSRASSPKRPSSMDSNAPPGIKREKTVLDVNLTEQQKHELYMEMVRQQSAHNRRLSLDHKRHEEQLKKRLENMKSRRHTDAQELFMRAERQKSNLEKAHQEERDRHISMTKERVARLRFEKTMTMKEKGSSQARRFDDLVTDQEASGMTEDEKMSAAARKVEDSLRQEEKKERKRKTPNTLPTTDDDNDDDPPAGQGASKPPLPPLPTSRSVQQQRVAMLMAEAERIKVLKQRRNSKKQQRLDTKAVFRRDQ